MFKYEQPLASTRAAHHATTAGISRSLKQLDHVAGRVIAENLFPSAHLQHLIPERDTCGFEFRHI